jgi:hypothetical protein
MNTLVSSGVELGKLLDEALPEVKELALVELKRRIDKYDLKLTDELYGSFKAAVLGSAAELQKEILISFNMYGRYKDLKYVEYGDYRKPSNAGKNYGTGFDSAQPPGDEPLIVHEMTQFILKAGIGKFKYVPGYTTNGSNRMPVTSRAITRLAWTLASSRMRSVRVKNRKKGWYNEARAVIVNKASTELRKRIATATANALRDQLMGLDVAVKL